MAKPFIFPLPQQRMQTFANQFMSRNLSQSFNSEGVRVVSDENESALHKWLRLTGKLESANQSSK